jgi:hypothetical protein
MYDGVTTHPDVDDRFRCLASETQHSCQELSDKQKPATHFDLFEPWCSGRNDSNGDRRRSLTSHPKDDDTEQPPIIAHQAESPLRVEGL